MGAFFEKDHLGWASAFIIGRLFLIPALARWLAASWPWSSKPGEILLKAIRGSKTAPESEDEGDSLWSKVRPLIAPSVGLGAPALLLIAAGLYPPLLSPNTNSLSLRALFRMPGWTGWLLWLGTLVGGAVLAWQEKNLRHQATLGLSAISDFLRLEWLYEALLGALERALASLRVIDEIVGGAGTLLWSWIVFLIMLLLWLGR